MYYLFAKNTAKGFPCFRPYLQHWMKHFFHTTQFPHKIPFICPKYLPKGFPCLRPYLTHWLTHLCYNTTEPSHICQFICPKNNLQRDFPVLGHSWSIGRQTCLFMQLNPPAMTNLFLFLNILLQQLIAPPISFSLRIQINLPAMANIFS